MRVITGGGGGYGDPAEREPELIHADLADGYVTPEATSAQYGHGGAR
jgi:N-methylhydantoinase B